MPKQPDPDEVLDRMRDEGRISDEEYDALRGEVVDDARPSGEDDTDLVDYEKPAEVSDPTPRLPKLTLRRDLTSTYLTLVLIGLAGLLVASSVGLLPWLVPILAIPTFGATLVVGWKPGGPRRWLADRLRRDHSACGRWHQPVNRSGPDSHRSREHHGASPIRVTGHLPPRPGRTVERGQRITEHHQGLHPLQRGGRI